MNKELILAGILLSISTALKICSVVAIYHISIHHAESEHPHEEHHITIVKQSVQTTHQPILHS